MDEEIEKDKYKSLKEVFAEALLVGIAADENKEDRAVRFVVVKEGTKYTIDVTDLEFLLEIIGAIESYKFWLTRNMDFDIENKSVLITKLSSSIMADLREAEAKGVSFENYSVELFRSWRLSETQIYLNLGFMVMLLNKIDEEKAIEKSKTDEEDMNIR